jgi:hypothetical protein
MICEERLEIRTKQLVHLERNKIIVLLFVGQMVREWELNNTLNWNEIGLLFFGFIRQMMKESKLNKKLDYYIIKTKTHWSVNLNLCHTKTSHFAMTQCKNLLRIKCLVKFEVDNLKIEVCVWLPNLTT